MASLPRPLAAAGVWLLRTEQLRMVRVRVWLVLRGSACGRTVV
jgi:hypothetical protein